MSFLTLILLLSSAPVSAASETCETYALRCDCFPNVPFEGYKLYVVETCNGKEEWSTEYAAPTFDSEAACRDGIQSDPFCQSLQ